MAVAERQTLVRLQMVLVAVLASLVLAAMALLAPAVSLVQPAVAEVLAALRVTVFLAGVTVAAVMALGLVEAMYSQATAVVAPFALFGREAAVNSHQPALVHPDL